MKSTIVATVLGMTALAALPRALHAEAGPEVGKPAPAFELPAVGGGTTRLEEHRGKIVVLEWVNHGCPWVRKFYEPGKMQEFQKKAAEMDVVWLTICSSAPGQQGYYSIEDWEAQVEARNMRPKAVLVDEDGTVGRAYEARTTPHMFVIDAEGILRYMGAIDDNNSRSSDAIEGARNYVMDAIQALKSGQAVPEPTSTRPYGCSVKYAK